MYRARIDSVSGTKVYADGKWLSCIGNKNHRVGDYIWTDGRCAYGHFQESQQPLIITKPTDDEGIPIAFINYDVYTFKKNKLTFLNNLNLEPKVRQMINDKKKNVFFDSEYVDSKINIIAENVDKDGNVFKIVCDSLFTTNTITVNIVKNNKTIKNIDLEPFRDKTVKDAPFPVEYYHVLHQTFGKTYTRIQWGFIENENDWAIIFSACAGEGTTYDFFWNALFPENDYWENFQENTAEFFQTFFLSSSQSKVIFKYLVTTLPWFSGVGFLLEDNKPKKSVILDRLGLISYTYYDTEYDTIKIPIQDGYYYKISEANNGNWIQFDNQPFIKKDKIHDSLTTTVYSPNDKPLFTFHCGCPSKILITKLNASSYLFSINTDSSIAEHDNNEKNGLYLYKDGNFELLVEGRIINQRLRPMKKIKGWQKRIKEISLNSEGEI